MIGWSRMAAAFAILALGPSYAACAQTMSASPLLDPTDRVLLAGDSWAELMWFDRTLLINFALNGRPDISEKGDVSAVSGSTAADWALPSSLAALTAELTANPTIDVVQLTLGGNDILAGQSGGGWVVGMPAQAEEALFQQIADDVATVIDHVLALDPELVVLLSLYDYPNLGEGLAFLCDPIWEDLGSPTPEQINLANHELQSRLTAVAATRPRVSIVSHLGLMQFYFGFPDDGIEPGELLPPGDITRPSPLEAMRLGIDCTHLGVEGYQVVAQNLWNHFYDEHFNGTIVRDGFESGGLSGWSQTP